jgi:hypothetical protein
MIHDTDKRERLIVLFCTLPKTRREYLRRCILNPLVKSGEVSLTLPDRPHNKNQKYIAN